jgi:uncharacterized protein YajQ (UPF0234 family)
MPSFDIVSKLDLQEVDNAVNNAVKEILNRFDFRNTNTELEREDKKIKIVSSDEGRVAAALDILESKLTKRGVSLKALERGKPYAVGNQRLRQDLTLVDGIAQDKAKDLVKRLKDSKLKVQASIQADTLRVSGKDRDELQRAIAFCRTQDFPLDLQFINFRE